MTSTTVTTTNLSLGLRRITTFSRKNPWPDPHLSIGESWCTLGKNNCWEAIGPAKEKYDEVSKAIKALLESQHEYLNEGVSIRRCLIFDVYMIGRSKEQAKPTIMFSSENRTQRQRAQRLVRGSGILDQYPGFALGDASRPLRLSSEPRPLVDEPSNDDIEMSDEVDSLVVPDTCWFYSHALNSIHGMPILIKRGDAGDIQNARKSTLGGIVCIRNKLFGVTVAHAFLDSVGDQVSTCSESLEFSLEDEDEDPDEHELNDEFIQTTSRGSVSPTRWFKDEAESSGSIDSKRSQDEDWIWPSFDSDAELLPKPTRDGKEKQETIEMPLILLGRISQLSRPTSTTNLDWALVQIECPELISQVAHSSMFPHVTHVISSISETKRVQAKTSSNNITDGVITGSSAFLQLPQSAAFQEMWVVQLDGPLKHGDCGSWVVDPDNGGLYGYITAGDPGTSIAYIVPAHQAFSEMEQCLESKVSLPYFQSVSKENVAGLQRHSFLSSQDPLLDSVEERRSEDKFRLEKHPFDAHRLFLADDNIRERRFSPYVSSLLGIEHPSFWSGSGIQNASGSSVRSSSSDRDRRHPWDDDSSGSVAGSSRPTTPSESSYACFGGGIQSSPELTWPSPSGSVDFDGGTSYSEEDVVDMNTPDLVNIDTPLHEIEGQDDDESPWTPFEINGMEMILEYDENDIQHDHVRSGKQPAIPEIDQHSHVFSSNPHLKLKGRQRNLTLAEKKSAREVRSAKACWACHLSRTKCSPCSPGKPCDQCARLSGKRRFWRFSCFNDPLESLSIFMVPNYLFGHFTQAKIESFVSQQASSWGAYRLVVSMSWGYGKSLEASVVTLTPKNSSGLTHSFQAQISDIDPSLAIAKTGSPPLAIPLASLLDMQQTYTRYIRDISGGDLQQYVSASYNQSNAAFPARLLSIIASYYKNSTIVNYEGILLRDAIEIHIRSTILERSLYLDENSLSRIKSILQEEFPSRSTPVVLQWQIKFAFFMTQQQLIFDVLKGWGNMMWTSKNSAGMGTDWATAFCVFSILTLVIDKTISMAQVYCEDRILLGRDAETEREAFKQLALVTQKELFERCKEIFHMKFKTMKTGKEACNPIRDGIQAWKGRPQDEKTAVLTNELQQLAKDFLVTGQRTTTRRPEDPWNKDEGVLARIFLEDFLYP